MADMHPSMKRLYEAAALLTPPLSGQTAVARAMNESPQTVGNWERRHTGVSKAGAAKAQSTLGISSTWILEGQLPMLVAGVRASVPASETASDYVRVDQLDAEGSMGPGRINDDFPEVVRSVDFVPTYIRSIVGFLPPPGRLKLVTGVGDSMAPKIMPGETVLVDTGCNEFIGPGLYLINAGDGHQIKALQSEPDGIWARSMDPVLFPPFKLESSTIIAGRVYLIQRLVRV